MSVAVSRTDLHHDNGKDGGATVEELGDRREGFGAVSRHARHGRAPEAAQNHHRHGHTAEDLPDKEDVQVMEQSKVAQ